jgi:hypothetical protein
MGKKTADYLKSSFFPNSEKEPIKIDSPETSDYNCVAWILGKTNNWYEPDEEYDWIEGLPMSDDLNTMQAFFEHFGFQVCEKFDNFDSSIELIAIFAKEGIFTHVAKLLKNGNWTSKLGNSYDVEHGLESISNGLYGEVALYMQKIL